MAAQVRKRFTFANILLSVFALIALVGLFVAVRQTQDYLHRHEVYYLSRVVYTGLFNSYIASDQRFGHPAVQEQEGACTSWRDGLLKYLVVKEGFEQSTIINAYNCGRRKCSIFAVVNRQGEWLSHGIQREEDSGTESPLLVIIWQDKYAWDECVDACIATQKDLASSPAEIFTSTAVFLDSGRFIWSSQDSKIPRHFILRKITRPLTP